MKTSSTIAKFFATGFGIGYMPIAPGTWGSVVGVALFLLIARLPALPFWIFVVGCTAIGVWSAEVVEKNIHKKDPGIVVIDEIVGIFISLYALPLTWPWILAGFLLFRLMDIIKPFPARWFQDNLPGGWGVMMDDVMAGVYTCLILTILNIVFLYLDHL